MSIYNINDFVLICNDAKIPLYPQQLLTLFISNINTISLVMLYAHIIAMILSASYTKYIYSNQVI